MALAHQCLICTTPDRKDIEFLLKKKMQYTDIAKQLYPLHEQEYATWKQFMMAIRNHHMKKHPPLIQDLLPKTAVGQQLQTAQPITTGDKTERYADALIELGLTPSMIATAKHKDIVAAQKLLIEKEKLKLQNDSLKLAMMKFMAGMPDEPQTLEVTDEQS